MVARQNNPGDTGPLDFFISYSPADERWASWIAWTLEEAGYRTVLQAWDFVPGTNFVDFMDRGVSGSAAVIAVLSRNYERSRYGRMEWQAALRADPDAPERRLITVRVEDIPVEGLLATITYVDLVPVADPAAARELLLARVRQALDGRARPSLAPGYPGGADGRPVPAAPAVPSPGRPLGGPGWAGRRRPAAPPSYPRVSGAVRERDAVTVLQLAGPAFGRGQDPAELQAAIWGDLVELADSGAPSPDLLVVTGDLTASGSRREFEQALAFLTGLRALLGLEPHRVALVPGGQDVNLAACQAYFSTCEADEMPPRPPYWPKWRHFARLFQELYQGLDVVFDSDQPWTLFPVPELHTVVAGLNSSMAYSHRRDDQYGLVGREQAAWFAQALRPHETEGWLRIGVVRHAPGAARAAAPGVRRAGTAALDGSGPLRDTDVLSRLTAPRLHLLLHGPAEPGAQPALATAAGEVPVIGASRPGGHQLVRVARDGVAVWQGPGEPRRRAVQWRRAERAFGPEAAPAGDREGTVAPAPEPEPRAVQTPAEILLARVAEVCRTRHEGAQIRPVDGPVPQLLVTWSQSGFVRQQRVAVHLGTPTAQDVDRFVALVHAADAEAEAELVHDGPPPARELRDAARRRGVRVRSFTEFQGLLDLRGYVAGQSERLRTDPRYPPGMYLPQRYREVERLDAEDRDGLVDEMLRLLDSDQGRFLLLLGDFGHGKTFALRELARRIPGELPHLVPLLIELHALDRAYSFEGLVAAHLAAHGVDNIDLRAFRYMLQQGRIVLLFDGFDELVNQVTYDRAAERLQVLLDSAVDSAKIVVSSRTQHFRSQGQVLTALGERVGLLPHRRVLAVREFSPQQIRAYLVNRYDGDERAADRRIRLLDAIPDLLALCRNPRLLGFVADLDDDRLRAVAGAGRALSPAGLYEEVLTAWLNFEVQRGSGSPGRAPGLSLEQLWDAVTALALRLWESGQDSLRLDELTDVAETLSGLADARLSVPQTAHAIGSGSLLVRSDDGVFRFIHGSVVEWLVARECARRLTGGDSGLLGRRQLSRLAVEFLCDLADHRICQAWAERELSGTSQDASSDAARGNAVRILGRLRVPAHTDLRGAALAGEDLSHRDFSGVDLTRADLTDARLVGANLSGAVLRGARLVGARLDGADLTGADLQGADLRRARLIGTDLTGARVAGGRWRRAALISATLGALDRSPELATAAIAPGMAVDSGFRPSAVGVPYGYDMRTSRLPEPISYSPDGELLAVGSEDGGVLVCEAATGIPLRTLQGHTGRVYAVKFRGRVLATGSSDGTVRLWDPVSGRCLHRLEIHETGVWPLVLDAEGTLLATGDADGLVTVWDTASGTPLHRLPGHAAPVYTVAFAPGDTALVTGDAAGAVRLWDLDTGRQTGELPGHRGAVYRARFSPDGTVLATADQGDDRQGGTVRVWDPATGALRHEFTGHSGRVYTLDFHPGGALLVSGDTEGEVRLWDLAARRSAGLLGGCRGAVYQVLFDPDGTLLAAGDSAGVVRLWRIDPEADPVAAPLGRQPGEHRGSVWVCKFRPHGDTPAQGAGALLVTGGNDGVVRLWEPATGQGRRILRGHGRRVGTLSFSADGSMLAAGGNDGVVRVWHAASGRRLRELTGQSDRLVSAAFGPAGPLLATASSDGDLYLWNAATGEYQRELDVETDHVWAEAFSADGELLATANDDDTVRLWYRATGAHVATITEHFGRVRAIAFRSDGTVLATGCDDRKVRIWDVAERRITAVLDGHTDRVYAVAFAPDGSWLAGASWDGTAVIWKEGEVAHRLTGHTGKLWTAAVHPLRPLLATAGDDRTVRLWNPDTGEETAVLTGHTGRILAVAFSPDGSLLASGGEDGTVRLWNVPADGPATLRATLVGMPGGWAALSASGGYKYEGDVTGEFWHAVGMCRFEPGELDGHLPGMWQVPLEDALE
ncbi:WD40 repeat-containing protein [Streptomyces incarnatus]|uniref:WD40 repeat-containing protein n=1 Tax=Streptomyces incarnatus TaxID=665007 RepID=A0ABM5THM7_9ACTN|nr:TIR domain-containing protein [Streptomyces incarnatus]AKJ10465.1 WD40 repeat-containing protein [Streptomyces incarnatus]